MGVADGTVLMPIEYKQGSEAGLLDNIRIQDAASGWLNGASVAIGNYTRGQDTLGLAIDDQLVGIDSMADAIRGRLTDWGSDKTLVVVRADAASARRDRAALRAPHQLRRRTHCPARLGAHPPPR